MKTPSEWVDGPGGLWELTCTNESDHSSEDLKKVVERIQSEALREISKQIREILKGIDKTESEYDYGWWETSRGAEFGMGRLKAIIELFKQAKVLAQCETCHHWENKTRWFGYCPVFNKETHGTDGTNCTAYQENYLE